MQKELGSRWIFIYKLTSIYLMKFFDKAAGLANLVLSISLLSACGGGGGGGGATTPSGGDASVPSYIDRYVGTWTTACLTDSTASSGPNESGKFIFVMSKASSTMLTVKMSAERYVGKTCTGALQPSVFTPAAGVVTYIDTSNGTDRFTSSDGNKTSMRIVGTSLTTGTSLGTLDSGGYPVLPDPKGGGYVWTKN
jgi:hypothetical protein